MFDKILVPLDGSEYSFNALRNAVKLAKLTNAAVTLIHVYPTGSSILTPSKEPFYQMQKEECAQMLETGKGIAKAEGLDVETLIVGGDAVEKIIDTANEGSFDLIVIGARGVGKLTGLLLGSVSRGVVDKAPCRVLVTKCA